MALKEVGVAYTVDVIAYVDLETGTVSHVIEWCDDVRSKDQAFDDDYNEITDESVKRTAYAIADSNAWPAWERKG